MRVAGLNSAFHKALQYQSIFTNPINHLTSHRGFSSLSNRKMDPNITRIITFWFVDSKPESWFMQNATFDAEIRDQFGPLIAQARTTTALDSWSATPDGTLAMILLLDQFTRNIYRGSPDSWSADPKALDIASRAILKGFDLELPTMRQPFMYLPLVHSELLSSQVAAKALMDGFAKRCKPGSFEDQYAQASVDQAKSHAATILRFGRYPSRNEVLGRESTEEEIEFLKEKPKGF